MILRNLDINGISGTGYGGLDGVRYLAGGKLVVEKCSIYGFTQNNIDVSLTGDGNLIVKNTTLTGGVTGVRVSSTTGTVRAFLDQVSITGAVNGVDGAYGLTLVSNSLISQNSGYGLFAENGGTISVVNSILSNNNVAAQAQAGSKVRLSNNDIFDNGTGLGCGGGNLASAGNNRRAGNAATGCAPNQAISIQ